MFFEGNKSGNIEVIKFRIITATRHAPSSPCIQRKRAKRRKSIRGRDTGTATNQNDRLPPPKNAHLSAFGGIIAFNPRFPQRWRKEKNSQPCPNLAKKSLTFPKPYLFAPPFPCIHQQRAGKISPTQNLPYRS